METRSLKFVAEACTAEILRGAAETLVENVCTDSRQAKPGDLFFAIRGEKFDGHDFLDEVAAKNVSAVVIEKGKIPAQLPECGVLVVDDARAALGKFAAAYRKDFALPIICVGGSNGKTTVKELLASVLKRKLNTLWSEASFNNDIGVPLTLLRLDKSHQAAVLEAGTNHPGELAPLMKMIQPKVRRADEHRARASGIFWRRRGRRAGRRLARGTVAGGRKIFCERRQRVDGKNYCANEGESCPRRAWRGK